MKEKVRTIRNHAAEDTLFCRDEKYVNKAIKAVSRPVHLLGWQFGTANPQTSNRGTKPQLCTGNVCPAGFPLVVCV